MEILFTKSGAIRGEQVFPVCHLQRGSHGHHHRHLVFNNYDYNAQSTELSVVKTWAGPVSASQLPLFSEYT